MKKALSTTLVVVLVLFVCCSMSGIGLVSQRAAARQVSDVERVAKNKQTILSRLKREPVEHRTNRLKWEWVDEMIRDYMHQKLVLIGEQSVGERYELSPRWVFKDMKVTFQELFNLGAEEDDRLLPLSYGDELLNLIPSYAFEGVTILGKAGEIKGPYKRSVAVNGPALVLAYRESAALIRDSAIIFPLYVNRAGKEKMALGFAHDAYTVKWKDIKNRVVDDMSEAAYVEKLKLLRDYISEEEFKEFQ